MARENSEGYRELRDGEVAPAKHGGKLDEFVRQLDSRHSSSS